MMIPEIFFVSFATLFAIVGPLDVSFIYASLTIDYTAKQRFSMAWKGTITALIILLVFALLGDQLLIFFGITLPAMQIAGGILLLLMSLKMVFAQPSDTYKTTKDERKEALKKDDIFVFPLATPLLAGPGSMGATVLLSSSAGDDWMGKGWVIASIFLVLFLSFIALITASFFQKYLGKTGSQVVERVFGVLLSALAIQFILNGLEKSPLLH